MTKIKRVELKKPKRVNTHFKTCRKCGVPFRTTAKYGRVCDECNKRPEFNKSKGLYS